MLEFEGQCAVVTGSARGIGRAIALELARTGANLTIVDLDESNAENVAKEIRALGRLAITAKTDVSSKEQVGEALRFHLARFQRLDIMVNNAGIGHVKPLLELTEQEWDRVMSINAKSVLFGIQGAARVMIEQGIAGRIVNIASVAGKGGRPFLAAYAASKAAVINLTQSAAYALSPFGITVNCVCPGYVGTMLGRNVIAEMKSYADEGKLATEQTKVPPAPLDREADPADIALMAVHLAGKGGAYVTGQAINVDGGRCMH